MAIPITPKGMEALVNILPTKKTELISEFYQLFKEQIIQIISENREWDSPVHFMKIKKTKSDKKNFRNESCQPISFIN